MPSRKTASLYFRAGASDKIYHVQLEELEVGKWSVHAQNGRRTGRLTHREKVKNVSWFSAKRAYDDLVNEKLGGGYSHGPLAGPSAEPAPLPAGKPAAAAVKLPPMPTWPDLDLAYAETATFFGEPATFTTDPQAWMVLMVDLAAGAQEGLGDAVAQVRRCKTDAQVLQHLSDEAKAWYDELSAAVQSASMEMLRGSCRVHKTT